MKEKILKIVKEIINEFNKPEVDNILKQIPEEELKLLNPFQSGIVNYKKFFRLALEEKNYEKIDWKKFNTQFLRGLVERVYEKNNDIGEKLRIKVVVKLNNIEELITEI